MAGKAKSKVRKKKSAGKRGGNSKGKGRGKGSGATVKRRVVDATARAIDGFDENVVTASKFVPDEEAARIDALLARSKIDRLQLLVSRAAEAYDAGDETKYRYWVKLIEEDVPAPPEKSTAAPRQSSSDLSGCISNLEERIANVHFRNNGKASEYDVDALANAIRNLPNAAREAGVLSLLDAADRVLEECTAFQARKRPV